MRLPIFLALSLGSLTAYAADPKLDAVFERMDKAAATFKGCTADVVKINHLDIIESDEKQTGTIAVRKSNPRTFQLLEKFLPDESQVELNGTHIQIYHPKTKMLNYDDLGKKYHGLVDEVLLVGLGGTSKDLLEGYNVSYGGAETVSGRPATRLVLIPKDPQLAQNFPKFEVWYSDATGIAVQQKWYQKGFADYYIQTYSNMKIGPVSEAEVKLVVPKDAHREHLFR